jgi:hypothetical protein
MYAKCIAQDSSPDHARKGGAPTLWLFPSPDIYSP